MPKKSKRTDGSIATNRRARHLYHIEQTFEAGIALVGSEVKSLRQGKAQLQDAYGIVRQGEIFLHGVHIPEYKQASILNHEPKRVRKLLLNRGEINKLAQATQQKGYTIVPLRLYFKDHLVKVELAVARGKQEHDKREAILEREHHRAMDRARSRRR